MKALVWIFLIVMLLACKNNAEIHQLNSSQSFSDKEYFIVEHYPKKLDEFAHLIKTHVDTTLSIQYIRKTNGFRRFYFASSRQFNRNFEESDQGYFSKDYIGDHLDNIICTVDFMIDLQAKQGSILYNYYEYGEFPKSIVMEEEQFTYE